MRLNEPVEKSDQEWEMNEQQSKETVEEEEIIMRDVKNESRL